MHAAGFFGMITGMSEEGMMPVRIKVLDVTMNGAVLLSVNSAAEQWLSKGDVLDIETPFAPAGGGNRWEAFSDEEVKEFLAGESDRSNTLALPSDTLDRASALVKELRAERNRRRGGYKGPGVYEDHTGSIYDVLGIVGDNESVILRTHAATGDRLCLETWGNFGNMAEDGTPAYRYLRALGG